MPSAIKVAGSVHRLLAASVIDRDTFLLGMQVVARMIRENARVITLTAQEASTTAVVNSVGHMFSGPLPVGPIPFTRALQGLHFAAGIHSSLTLADLDSPDIGTRHFTRNPRQDFVGPAQYVYLKLPSMSYVTYEAAISSLIHDHIGGRILDTIELNVG